MSKRITLRPVRADDHSFLLRVYAGSRAAELAAVPWSREQTEEFLRFQFDAQRQYYVKQFPDAQYKVVLVDDEPVGRLYVDRLPDEIRILDIALLPEHHGLGIGSKLIRSLMQEAAKSRKPIRIHVETHQPSMAIFERLGFAKREDHGVSYLMEWNP